MKKDLQIKLYFEKKKSQMTKKLFLEQRLLWLAAVLYIFFFIRGGNSEACQMGRHLSIEVHVILHCSWLSEGEVGRNNRRAIS